MKELYKFHSALVLRTPAVPFNRHFDEHTVRQQAADPAFAEALYLASPALSDESQRLLTSAAAPDAKKEAKLHGSLLRYYARMSSRCTPFALFAGCGLARWGEVSHVVRDAAPYRRHTRLDMHYTCTLVQWLQAQPNVRERLHYFPNSSLYTIGEEIRYTERHHEAGREQHQLSAVAASEPLRAVLDTCRGGALRIELVHCLLTDGITPEDAQAFVDELIEGQLLVSELEPTVTGPEFMAHVEAVLTRLQQRRPCEQLREVQAVLADVRTALQTLDRPGATNDQADYARIVQRLQALEVPIELGKLFQVDQTYDVSGGTLARELQAPLLEAVEALTRLAEPPAPGRLEHFAERFYARYEDREVPLLEALDNESGIGYSAYGKTSFSSLVHDLAAGGAGGEERAIRQSEVQHFLYQKLRAADREGAYHVTITPEELQAFEPTARPLAPSIPVLFHLADDGQIVLESVGGSSAANLLGRFAHADAGIDDLVRDITRQEQEHNPAVRFAEVCHLPSGRIGNILQRPHFRALEIPYLAQSGLPAAQQVPLQDLYVSVRRGQLVLRSARQQAVIIPRLSSAHNYTRQSLPVYQFLCDLQTQGLQARLGFSWQAVAFDTKFWPRLTYQRVVLQVASWQLVAADYQALLTGPADTLAARFEAFRAQWRLPELFTLADGDNELLVDARNPATVRAWLDAIRTRPSIQLKEFLFDPTHAPVTDTQGRPYVSQFIATLIRTAPSYVPVARRTVAVRPDVPREFALGSEWFYTKLYCGPKVANRVLISLVKPLTEALEAAGLIDRWFFIRYADPDNHLRLRLHLPDPARIGEVIHMVNEYLEPLRAAGYIWKSQTDTYRRELERYGHRSIEQAEALFCADSRAAVALVAYSADEPEADTLHWLWGLRLIDALLEAFDYPLERKMALLRHTKDAFAAEFGGSKELKLQVDTKYRQHRAAIHEVLQAEAGGAPEELLQLLAYHHSAAVEQAVAQLLSLQQDELLEVELDQLLASYIHMLLNRLISVQARLHEMVIYDFLYRHYHSELARRNKAAISCSLP